MASSIVASGVFAVPFFVGTFFNKFDVDAFVLSSLVTLARLEVVGFDAGKLLSDVVLRTGKYAGGDAFGVRLTGDGRCDVENIWHIPWKLYASSLDISAVIFTPGETRS